MADQFNPNSPLSWLPRQPSIGQAPNPSAQGISGASPPGSTVSSAAFTAAGIVGSGFLNQLTQEINYESNARNPTNIPDLQSLFRLAYSQLITPDVFQLYGSYYGAQLGVRPNEVRNVLTGTVYTGNQRKHSAWRALYQLNRPSYDIGFLRKLYRQGVPGSEGLLRFALRQRGFVDSAAQNLFVNETEWLSPSTLTDLWYRRVIAEDELVSTLQKLGWSLADASRIVQTLRRWIDPQLALTLNLFGRVETGELDEYLEGAGFKDARQKELVKLTRFTPPSVGGVLGLGQRQTWNDVFSDKWGLDKDQPPQVKEWLKRLGTNFSAGTDDYGTTGDTTFPWSKALWRGQWSLPSLGDLAQIIYRFRGDPANNRTWSQPGYPPLSQDDVWDVLKANGMPELMRNYWGRLVYQPIGMRFLRTIVETIPGVTQQWVAGKVMDSGYAPNDAAMISQAIIAAAQKPNAWIISQQKRATSKYISAVESAYQTGSIDNGTALAELTGIGLPSATAQLALSAVDIAEATRLIQQVVSRTTGDVYAGRITIPQGQTRLLSQGMAPARVAQLVSTWTVKLSEGRKQLATAKILQLLRQGILSEPLALARLTNLGWSKPDEVLLLAGVQAEVNKQRATALKATEAGVRRQEGQITRLLSQMASGAASLQRRLKEITPVARILTWYAEGYWSEDKAKARLSLLGFPADVQDTMLLESLTKKPAGVKPPAKLTEEV